MANPLAKSIMNNISKKSNLKVNNNVSKITNVGSLQNINNKEEELLKSILYKNINKVNINSLKNKNTNKVEFKDQSINKQSIKELANKKEVKEYSNTTNSKEKNNKKIISLKDLAK